MMADGIRVAPGIPYRQLQGMVGKMLRRYNTPVFSQMYKRINKLDTDILRGPNGLVMVSDRERSRVLALDTSGLKQHNRGEWIRAKWKKRRGFVKIHVLVDTETMKVLELEVTDDSVGDSTMFKSLLGQIVDTDGALHKEPLAAPHLDDYGTKYENHPTSGVSPLASFFSGVTRDRIALDLLLGDAAYGSRKNIAACARAWMTPRHHVRDQRDGAQQGVRRRAGYHRKGPDGRKP